MASTDRPEHSPPPAPDEPLHHLIARQDWHRALTESVIPTAPEGFVHLSATEQVFSTAARFYSARNDLMVVSLRPVAVQPWLRWEESHPGQWFPHVYAPLPVASIEAVTVFPRPFIVPEPIAALGRGTGVRLADPGRDARAVIAAGDVVDGRRSSNAQADVTEDRLERYRRLLSEPDGLALVYEEGGDVLSAVIGVPERAGFGRGEVIPGSMHLASVATHRDAEGRGLASLLLHHLRARLRERGVSRCVLWTHTDNGRARHLYERLGFARTGAPHAYDALGSEIVQYQRTEET